MSIETMTEDERAHEVRKSVLRDIKNAARDLKSSLTQVRRDADYALECMSRGMSVYTGVGQQGPLGTQSPADVLRLTAQLNAATDMAMRLGLSEIEIQDAYLTGAGA